MIIDKKFLYRILPNWTDTFYYSAFSCIFPSPCWTCSWKWLQFGSVQLLSHVWLFETPWTAARQAFLSFTISRSLLKLVSSESVMPSKNVLFILNSTLQIFGALNVIFFVCLFYVIMVDSAGSLLLVRFFCSCGERGLLSSCSAWASHCGGFSLWSTGSRACRLQ